MVQPTQKSKKSKSQNKNVLETLASLGSQTTDTIKSEAKATSDEFFRQLLGQQKAMQEKRSGDLDQGRPVDVEDIVNGREEQKQKFNEQIFFERRLFSEERESTSKRLEEMKLKLQAIMSEANKMVASAQNLGETVKNAVMQNPVAASEYQIHFFEDIITLVVSFRKKIDSAITWLQGSTKRAEKKNYWCQYKKKGAGFLLSGESYSQRSAG